MRSHLSSLLRRTTPKVEILPEVVDALRNGCPVVALESTIVAHGMPFPGNFSLASDVADLLRSKGVVPATIAIKDGVFRAGLHQDEILDLAKAGEEGRATKCSTRDLPLIGAKLSANRRGGEEGVLWGATTVAATMRLAHLANIPTFVTGGTGGVHRGGERTMDISTDLVELSRTPVVVVSAGVKSILDIRKTLEVLETYAVPTGVWRSNEFPAFFSPQSGVRSPARFDCADEVASSYLKGLDLGLQSGTLVAVPNDDPAGQSVEDSIQEALKEADERGIVGNDITPFILKTVADMTRGDSLRSNMSLVKSNAVVGADIASAISKQMNSQCCGFSSSPERPKVVCVGGAVMDIVATSSKDQGMIAGTSNPGQIRTSDGGVARNIAEVLGRLGSRPTFYTAVGHDHDGLISRLNHCGVITENSVFRSSKYSTARYAALLDHRGDLVAAVSDMDCLQCIPVPPSAEDLVGVEYLVLDANAPADSLVRAAKNGVEAGAKVCFDPTSVPKASLLTKSSDFLSCLSYMFPNTDELYAMARALDDWVEPCGSETSLVEYASSCLLGNMREKACLVITRGHRGLLLATKSDDIISYHDLQAEKIDAITSSNGAGDTLCGSFIHAKLEGASDTQAAEFGQSAAKSSLLYSEGAISPDLDNLKYEKMR